MNFTNSEKLFIVILCVTSIVDTVVGILTFIKG